MVAKALVPIVPTSDRKQYWYCDSRQKFMSLIIPVSFFVVTINLIFLSFLFDYAFTYYLGATNADITNTEFGILV